MDVGRQLQGFVGRQPRTPQAETRVAEPSASLRFPAMQAIADAESSCTGAYAASASSQVGSSETNALTTTACATIGCPASWASSPLKHEGASRASVESHALLSIASGSCTTLIRVCS